MEPGGSSGKGEDEIWRTRSADFRRGCHGLKEEGGECKLERGVAKKYQRLTKRGETATEAV